ncbi:MAG: hypothetical protein E7646_05450 [Ruminococcaceae bacterium]|nr:hypothetical protein [Oscillospiraceae bacterium]
MKRDCIDPAAEERQGFADCHLHVHDGDREGAMRFLDVVADCGVTDASILCVNCWSIFSQEENDWALWLKNNYKRMELTAFASFYEHGERAKLPYLLQLKGFLESGFDGIKLLQMKPEVRKELGKGIDHESYDAAFDLLEELGTPILCHSGDPEEMWDKDSPAYAYDESFPKSEDIYKEVFNRLDKNPRLNICFAHFFFLSNFPQRAVEVMEKYPRVKFDLTPGWEMFLGFSKDIDTWHDFFERYSDRILFGTDSNNRKKPSLNLELNQLVKGALAHSKDEFDIACYGRMIRIRGLEVSEDSLEKICFLNYKAFIGR